MCGIFGLYLEYPNVDCVSDVIHGLKSLQHRGQESCGISYFENNSYVLEKGCGLVKDVFKNYTKQPLVQSCIGHVRYSTSGKSKMNIDSKLKECQPLTGKSKLGDFVLVHNGNIPQIKGHDTKYLVDFLSNMEKDSWEEKLIELIETIPGVFSILINTRDGIYALRDRFGIRPLCIGTYRQNVCFSSESCALDEYIYYTDVKPGELVLVSNNVGEKIESIYTSHRAKTSICAFEFVYFLNPTSYCDGIYVKDFREKCAEILANKDKKKFDITSDYIVAGVPASGILYGKSYARTLGISYSQILTKRKDSNRTFILPNNESRKNASDNKFIYNIDEIKGKKLIIVDDSIVRGNVMKSIVSKLRENGAIEVHVRIPSPPVINKCQYGIDIPTVEELLIPNKSYQEVIEFLNVTSLLYLDYEELNKVLPITSYKECFGGNVDSELSEWSVF